MNSKFKELTIDGKPLQVSGSGLFFDSKKLLNESNIYGINGLNVFESGGKSYFDGSALQNLGQEIATSSSGYFLRQLKNYLYTGMHTNPTKDYLSTTGILHAKFDSNISYGSHVRIKFKGYIGNTSANTSAFTFYRGSTNLLSGKVSQTTNAIYNITGLTTTVHNNNIHVRPIYAEWTDFDPQDVEYSAPFIPVDGGSATLNRRGLDTQLAMGFSEFTIEEYSPISNLEFRLNASDAPPLIANPYDDEFNGSSLNPKWSGIQTGSHTNIVTGGFLYIDALNGGTKRIQGLSQMFTGINWEYTMKFSINAPISLTGYGGGLLFIGNTIVNKFLYIAAHSDGAGNSLKVNVTRVTGYNTFSSTPSSLGVMNGPYYFKISNTGAFINFFASNDGIFYKYLYQEATGIYLNATPNIVGIGPFAYDSDVLMKVEWFRRSL